MFSYFQREHIDWLSCRRRIGRARIRRGRDHFSFLIKSGLSKRRAGVYSFLVAALTTPIGAFVAYPFATKMNDSFLGLSLGFVVGVLIYLSASHLLPEAREYEDKHVYWAFISGMLLGLFMFVIRH